MSDEDLRPARIGRIVGAVLRQAVRDARADGVLLLAAETPGGQLAHRWCTAALGAAGVRTAGTGGRWLSAHPASKTALLLSDGPDASLLPLGDLYASEILQLTGAWSAPADVRELVTAAGDVAALDTALRQWAEERRPLPQALAALHPQAATAVAEALHHHRFARWHCGLVPKLTSRTLGIDLWE